MYQASIVVPLTEAAATMNLTNLGNTDHIEANEGVDLTLLYNAVRVFYIIIPMIFFTALAQLIGQLLSDHAGISKFWRYNIESILIVIPTLLITLKFHKQAGYITIVCSAILVILLLVTYITNSKTRLYMTGSRRPYAYPLNRAIVYVIAILGLGAPRFLEIPIYMKETHGYGVGFLDIFVGLYIFAIATVRRSAAESSPVSIAPRFFLPMLFLSFVRTIIVVLNEEDYDDPIKLHENYYFLFSIVVMTGSIICEYVKSQRNRIRTGMAILVVHETILQILNSDFILEVFVERDYIIHALKSVYLSIPGFLALYLISVVVGDKLRERTKHLPGEIFAHKILTNIEMCVALWILTLTCIFTTSISRINCNVGYVTWILAIGCTMTLMHLLVFSYIFKTLKHNERTNSVRELNVIPEFVRVINKNGILCYIIGYLLASSMKTFLSPQNRNENEAFSMLTVYMFLMALFSYFINNVTIFDL